MGKKIDRTGEEKYNSFGSKMIIKEYKSNKDIDVYFPEYNWTFKHATYQSFKTGKINCPYEKRYFGKGYLVEGKYKMSPTDVNKNILEKLLKTRISIN